ncbi:MAG: DNA repair protein RecO [Candidatus Omnitrophica bacterium CG1_02_46_14]|nr:MAG: DNA repair protein RecO [Candidatus Omnitrophica bacterium CG1_02_46_14]
MSAAKSQAFALKTQDYRDTSLLTTFFTRDYGKIRGIVKGIRGARAGFGSTVEPFSLNEILFYKRKRGGDLYLITQIDLENQFLKVRNDLERLSYASYFIDLLDQLVETEEPNPAIFDLVHDALLFLSTGASCKRTARIFEVKLFKLLGLMPEIKVCVVCQTKTPEPAYFNVSLGGICCKICSENLRFPVSRGTLNFLEHARRAPFKELGPVKVSHEVGVELEKFLRSFVDFHLPYKLKSIIFLEKMELV